jgi:hypothetical protein
MMNLGYYESSNTSSYYTSNISFEFKRLLLLRLPILNLTKIKECIYFNTIKTPEKVVYCELGYGLNKISQIIDLGLFSTFKESTYMSTVFRISIALPSTIGN